MRLQEAKEDAVKQNEIIFFQSIFDSFRQNIVKNVYHTEEYISDTAGESPEKDLRHWLFLGLKMFFMHKNKK